MPSRDGPGPYVRPAAHDLYVVIGEGGDMAVYCDSAEHGETIFIGPAVNRMENSLAQYAEAKRVGREAHDKS